MQQPCPNHEDSCESVIYQTVDVGLPIALVPSIDFGNVKIICCGQPRVECCDTGGVFIRITQTVTCKIPIAFSVEVNAGAVTSQCKRAAQNTNCRPCCRR